MTDPKLRGACIGAGYFSRFQYDSWNRIPEVEIVACCNRTVDKAVSMADEFGIPRVYSSDEFATMLDELKPDFVDIITPPETHLDYCRIAAERGIAIICQKPVAPTWNEVLQIQDVLKSNPVPFMVHENWRWQPWYREIRKLVDEGVLGELFHCTIQCRMGDGWGQDAYLARQPFFRDYPRLFIYETGVHFIDTFRFLFGDVESVYSRIARRNPVIKGEDSALLVCNHDSGVTSVLDANRYNESDAENPRYTFGKIRVEGSKGHLEVDFDGSIRIKPLGEPSYVHDYTPSREGFAGDCVHAIQQHFVRCMIESGEFESTLETYMPTIRLVEAAYASASANQVVGMDSFNPS